MSLSKSPAHAATTTNAASMAPAHAWQPSGNAARRRQWGRVRVAAVAVALSVYVVGIGRFTSHFVPGTTVNGIDASFMTTDQLAEALEERVDSYQQHLTSEGGFELTFSGTDVSLTCRADEVAAEALDRTTAALWPLRLLSPQRMLIDTGISADEDELAELTQTAVAAFDEDAEQPTNASATFDEEQGVYVVSPESTGTALDAEAVTRAAELACRGLTEEVALGEDALLQPERSQDDKELLAVIAQANDSISKDLELVSDGEVVANVTAEMKRGWLSVDDDLTVAVDGASIYQWVIGNEAIYSAGDRSDEEHVWELDALNTAGNTAMAIRDAGDGPVEVVRTLIETKPAVTPGAKELGRHMDVNLSTQFARFYDNNGTVIWDSYLVSGGWDYTMGVMHATPTGTFHLLNKLTNQTLIGEDLDGDKKPDYESFVNYWMPFIGNDVGFHDATWRSEFGGDIRSWYGSHGCVNLPYAKAEELWGIINIGDMVVVHY